LFPGRDAHYLILREQEDRQEFPPRQTHEMLLLFLRSRQLKSLFKKKADPKGPAFFD
jgi:hypothetical protein